MIENKNILKKYVIKNYERIEKTNLYDLLLAMNSRIDSEQCIIDLLSTSVSDYLFCHGSCEDCIQKWLNAEV